MRFNLLFFFCWLADCIHFVSSSSPSFFNEYGRLEQVELACKASVLSGSLLAAHNKDAAIMFSCLHDDEWSEHSTVAPLSRVYRISSNLGMGLSGISSDGNYLANEMIQDTWNHDYVFSSKPRIQRLVQDVASTMHENTLQHDCRPFGVRLCFIGCNQGVGGRAKLSDGIGGEMPVVIEVDPLGNYLQCKLCCLGRSAEEMLSQWNVKKDPIDMSLPDVITECIRVLRSTSKIRKGILKPDGITISFVGKQIPFTIASREAVTKAIDDGDLSFLLKEVDEASEIPLSPKKE